MLSVGLCLLVLLHLGWGYWSLFKKGVFFRSLLLFFLPQSTLQDISLQNVPRFSFHLHFHQTSRICQKCLVLVSLFSID
jgi:hypothetical protein